MAKATNDRKKVDKIYSQITRIAQKGKDYTLEYHKLVDDIVAKGDFSYLEMCLSDYFNIDPVKYKTIFDIKKRTWKSILFETDSTMILKLKRLYKEKNVYQQGLEIRSDNPTYVTIQKKGPYLAEEVGIKTSYNTETKRTKYNLLPGSLNQIEVAKSATSSKIEISVIDEKIYKIEVSKVIWATFSVPIYLKPMSVTQSSVREGDLLVLQMKELNKDGSFKNDGIFTTGYLRINDIQDFTTKEIFIGSNIGDKNKVDIYKIYRNKEDVASLLGINSKGLVGVSNLFETTILEIRRKNSIEVESPYETNRLLTIFPSGTQSYLLPNVATQSGIPMSHGGDYLVTTYRRDSVGWYQPNLTHEVYSYRVDVRKDNLLGTIKEFDYDGPAYEYLQRNKQFAQIMGIKKTFLQVDKLGATSSITIVYEDLNQSEENNLYTRYKIAIDYLNS